MATKAEEKYVEAYEKYRIGHPDNIRPDVKADKDIRAGYYITVYGANALEEFKKEIQGDKPFNYQKMNASEKELYSTLNYVKNSNEREKMLTEGVEKLMSSEEYQKFLEFNSHFHNYSFNNSLLIYIQKPDATRVAGFTKWKNEFGAGGINKGEKGIMVSRPNIKEFTDVDKLAEYLKKHEKFFTKNEQERLLTQCRETGKTSLISSFQYVYVWDVSQLHDKEGNPLKLDEPVIRKQIGLDFDVPNDFHKLQDSLAMISPVSIRFVKNPDFDPSLERAYGYYSAVTDSISVRDKGYPDKNGERSEQDCIRTTIHEIAHSILHAKEMKEQGIEASSMLDRSQKEVEAESVAYLVCNHLGIDSSCNSFGYLASYLPNDPEARYKALEKSINRINKCADTIIEKLDKELERQEKKEIQDKTTEGYPLSVDVAETLECFENFFNSIAEATDDHDAISNVNDALEAIDNAYELINNGDPSADSLDELITSLKTVSDIANEEAGYLDDWTLRGAGYDDINEQLDKAIDELNTRAYFAREPVQGPESIERE